MVVVEDRLLVDEDEAEVGVELEALEGEEDPPPNRADLKAEVSGAPLDPAAAAESLTSIAGMVGRIDWTSMTGSSGPY